MANLRIKARRKELADYADRPPGCQFADAPQKRYGGGNNKASL